MTISGDRALGHAPIDHRAAVGAETARFAAAVEGADFATPVPSCPGWTLADLVRHTGSVHRWFSVLLHGRIQEPPRSRDVDLELPAGDDGWADWLAGSAAVAADAFRATAPDTPMWAWGADQHARFWARRMLFETLVHRVDAELALGVRPEIDRALAVDGVDEFLTNLPFAGLFAPKVADLRADGRTIRFRSTDGHESWLVRLRPDGFGLDPADDGAAAADATVRGAAADLLLLAYGRLSLDADAVAHEGDGDLLAHWFANSAF
ncbi:maleylpyruvate isomerase family mycothiol-dependent enzyme [Kitasatospora sp. DSM 101779]|uniref:maleylpyruvate isomerase family mycothiol-dependent enzyme n=1 Tax=Kitasatospora sp. DSM 101779 TaxID=2853165 RepID=UPI0021DA7C9B|nr:maleylpyruvate isomerase family mycothiol-dependent enzyme [Kitasatospora sp. DSM 101779]MCU7820846.1 maleylpyruvate isomerase family mycothiol-dependent enzyme [Kitasatospora sp. DSM 101779]